MGFELDITDMERHAVELRLFIEKAQRRFAKAGMLDKFERIMNRRTEKVDIKSEQECFFCGNFKSHDSGCSTQSSTSQVPSDKQPTRPNDISETDAIPPINDDPPPTQTSPGPLVETPLNTPFDTDSDTEVDESYAGPSYSRVPWDRIRAYAKNVKKESTGRKRRRETDLLRN